MIRPALALLGLVLAAAASAAPPMQQSFDMRVPVAPTAIDVGGTPRLVYELHLGNHTGAPMALTGLQVLAAGDGRVLAHFDAAALAGRLGRPGFDGGDPLQLAPGTQAVLYVELDLEHGQAAPRALRHRLEYAVVSATQRTAAEVTGAPMPLAQQPPAVLGPPLRGGPWVAIFDASWERGHRRVIYTVDGRARIPGRYAIDWVRLDADGRGFPPGRDDETAARYGHGAPVLAVADAVVAAALDGVAESATISGHTSNPFGEAAGNYIALDLGDGRYVLYEHLEPGSVQVAAGDRVTRGQVIGALGFTGDSTGPHLHLHVADSARPLAGEGLPYVFDGYRLLGRYDSIEAVGTARWRDTDARDRTRQRPAPLSVVEFPTGTE